MTDETPKWLAATRKLAIHLQCHLTTSVGYKDWYEFHNFSIEAQREILAIEAIIIKHCPQDKAGKLVGELKEIKERQYNLYLHLRTALADYEKVKE